MIDWRIGELEETAVRGSVSRWGSSLVLRLPSALTAILDLAEGSAVDMRVEALNICKIAGFRWRRPTARRELTGRWRALGLNAEKCCGIMSYERS